MDKQPKVRVGVAAPRKTRKSNNFKHISSGGFFNVFPLMYKICVPDEKVVGKGNLFSRSNAMIDPVLTDIFFHVNQFYVRYKDVWSAWDDYDNKTLHYWSSPNSVNTVPSIPVQCPYIKNSDFVLYFCANPTFCTSVQSTDPYDIVMQGANGPSYFALTYVGFRAMKLLNALGYKPSFVYDDETKIEILNLLCYGKAFMDWYFPSMYLNSNSNFRNIVSAFNCNDSVVQAGSGSNENSTYFYAIFNILEHCTTVFLKDSDYYFAWDSPSGPNEAVQVPLISIPDNQNDYPFNFRSAPGGTTYVEVRQDVTNNQNANGTPTIAGSMTSSGGSNSAVSQFPLRLNQFLLDNLNRLTSVVNRYRLTGVRAVDRFLSRYGVKLTDDHRSMFLKSDDWRFTVGDVEANSDSSNGTMSSNVGDLAGKGATAQDITFKFSTGSHAGLFLMLLNVSCDFGLYHGADPMHYNVDSLDWYNPEFDSLGVQVVPQSAIQQGRDGSHDSVVSPYSAFGFMKRYYPYLVDHNIMSGAFNTTTFGQQELMSWVTQRFVGSTLSTTPIVHSLSLLQPNFQDNLFVNGIFYNALLFEQFKIIWRSKYEHFSCIKPLKDNYDFEDPEQIEVYNGGKFIGS